MIYNLSFWPTWAICEPAPAASRWDFPPLCPLNTQQHYRVLLPVWKPGLERGFQYTLQIRGCESTYPGSCLSAGLSRKMEEGDRSFYAGSGANLLCFICYLSVAFRKPSNDNFRAWNLGFSEEKKNQSWWNTLHGCIFLWTKLVSLVNSCLINAIFLDVFLETQARSLYRSWIHLVCA